MMLMMFKNAITICPAEFEAPEGLRTRIPTVSKWIDVVC
jgi:hypothetical protein